MVFHCADHVGALDDVSDARCPKVDPVAANDAVGLLVESQSELFDGLPGCKRLL